LYLGCDLIAPGFRRQSFAKSDDLSEIIYSAFKRDVSSANYLHILLLKRQNVTKTKTKTHSKLTRHFLLILLAFRMFEKRPDKKKNLERNNQEFVPINKILLSESMNFFSSRR
jgi:hypothetical protein